MNSEGSVRQCSWQQGMRIAVFELSIWARCLYNCSPYVLSRWLYAYVHPLFGSWWSQWGVMAARHFCHSWCKWWSDTLWAALPRLWLHLLFLCFFGFGWNGHNSYPQCVLVEYSLWSHGYISIWARWPLTTCAICDCHVCRTAQICMCAIATETAVPLDGCRFILQIKRISTKMQTRPTGKQWLNCSPKSCHHL